MAGRGLADGPNKHSEPTAEEPNLRTPTKAVWTPGWAGNQ